MTARKNGGAAFPIQGISDGMTLRDWLAGQALVGLVADSRWDFDPGEGARVAYRWADAMLAAREGSK